MNPLTRDELRGLFGSAPHRFQLGIRRGNPANWFTPAETDDAVLTERTGWLTQFPSRHALWSEEAKPVLAGAREWCAAHSTGFEGPTAGESRGGMSVLGSRWVPDFLLLRHQKDGDFNLVGGCVCFPSGWAPEEKLGRSVAALHEKVPTLNRDLGVSIATFLNRLPPNEIYERENWGIAGTDALNLHPALGRPSLPAGARLDQSWLRIERQAFIRLPRIDGVMFLIRIERHLLAHVTAEPEIRTGLRNQLASMSVAVAEYKGLTAARPGLIAAL